MPCLIFTVVTNNEALREARNLVLPPLVGFGNILLGYAVGMLVASLGPSVHGMTTRRQRATFALTVGMFNYGYIPLPLVKLLFDDQTLGVLFVHNLGVELALWTFGVLLLSGHLGKAWWRQMLNPVSGAIVVALLFNFTEATPYLPIFLTRGIGWLGETAIPISLLLVGATIADQLRRRESPPDRAAGAKTAAAACLLRLGLLPPLMLLVVSLLPATDELKRVVAIQAAMPTALFPIVLARLYAGSPGVAALIGLTTSAISFVTIPFWIPLGLRLLGVE
jgi:predicted permease